MDGLFAQWLKPLLNVEQAKNRKGYAVISFPDGVNPFEFIIFPPKNPLAWEQRPE